MIFKCDHEHGGGRTTRCEHGCNDAWAPIGDPEPVSPPETTAPTATEPCANCAGLAAMVESLSEALAADPERYGAFIRSRSAPHTPTENIMATGEFHQRDGWYFQRTEKGGVRIRKTMSAHEASATEVEHTIPAEEWVSVIAHLSAIKDGAVAYGAAAELHHGPQ